MKVGEKKEIQGINTPVVDSFGNRCMKGIWWEGGLSIRKMGAGEW